MALEKIVVSNAEAEAEIFLQGAHVTQWTPRGQRPVLFLSARSLFEPGIAIRGGVPIIFPWFGPRHDGNPGPSHGLVRTARWDVESSGPEITLALPVGAARLRFRVKAGTSLAMSLDVRNDSSQPLVYEEALHTYFAVGDIRSVSVAGLEGTTFIDKADGMKRSRQPALPITFGKETDRVYVNTDATCVIDDPVLERRIVVEKTGSLSTVVWNPWIDKAAAMADFGPDEWQRMVCVETANVGENAVTLAPGQTHTMTVSISLSGNR